MEEKKLEGDSEAIRGVWPHISETKALSKNSSPMSHLSQSQRGFGWFITELQGIWPKRLKPHVVLAPPGRMGPSLLLRTVTQPCCMPNLVSFSQACKNAAIKMFFILQLRQQAWEKLPECWLLGPPTQASPDSQYQLERGFEVKSLETSSCLRPARISWLNLSHPPNKNSMFHQQNASSPIRSIFSK